MRGPRFTRVRTSKSFTALDGSYRAEIPWADHFLTSFLPLRPCNSYARGTTDYQPDRDSAARLLRISLRFRVWFLELRVSLVTSWTTSTLVKMCELDGVPALGVGAALAGRVPAFPCCLLSRLLGTQPARRCTCTTCTVACAAVRARS